MFFPSLPSTFSLFSFSCFYFYFFLVEGSSACRAIHYQRDAAILTCLTEASRSKEARKEILKEICRSADTSYGKSQR